MKQTTAKELMNWAENELIIKYGGVALEESRIARATMLAYNTIIDAASGINDFNIGQVAEDLMTLLAQRSLTPVYDFDCDWKKCEDGYFTHRRLPKLMKTKEHGIYNIDRFIVHELTKDGFAERRALDEELILMSELHPITFPYDPKDKGALLLVRSESYIMFLKYKDECSGEVIDIRKTYKTNAGGYEKVFGMEMLKVAEEMDAVLQNSGVSIEAFDVFRQKKGDDPESQ